MELLGDPVAALDHAARDGAAPPAGCCRCRAEPVGIEADVRGADPARPGEVVTVRGQHAVAVAPGRVESRPADSGRARRACPEARRGGRATPTG